INLNIRYGNTNLKIFEIGKIFKHTDDNKALLPGYEEREILAISLIGKTFPKQWSEKERPFDFYDLKGFVEDFADFLRLPISFSKIDSDGIYSPNSLKIELDNYTIGYCGYVNRGILKNYDIEEDVLLAEIDFSQITHYKTVENKYEPVSPFPTVDRDLAFIVDESTEAKSLLDEIRSNGGKLLSNVLIFDVYAGKNIPEGKKSLAFSLIFSSSERTLTDEEVDSTINQIIKAVESKFNAQLRKM
ncbi:MAG TPA: hypothetical protein PLV01_00775, partial [Candidatus Kapabacteria bacterium]|nr:hypothetical protein [Candidatus Kapabacteria bacterium]